MTISLLLTHSSICHSPTAQYVQLSCMHVKSHQLCPILCSPMVCSPPGSSVHGILQARILEWGAMPSSRDLPDPGRLNLYLSHLLCLLHWQAGSLPLAKPGEPHDQLSTLLKYPASPTYPFLSCKWKSTTANSKSSQTANLKDTSISVSCILPQ